MRRSLRQQVGDNWQGVRALGLCIDDKPQHRWVTSPDGPVCSLCTQLDEDGYIKYYLFHLWYVNPFLMTNPIYCTIFFP